MGITLDWRDFDASLRVPHGQAPTLTDKAALGDGLFENKEEGERSVAEDSAAINRLQDLLYAEGRRSLLVILQGIDTAGKDGTVRDVFNATGPMGVEVTSFGRPSEEEMAHDYLWRVHKAVPRRGMIGIFNRSHYEDVLVVKVRKLVPEAEIEKRYDQINAFERHLSENGVTILKFMLHISKSEQRERLRKRLEDPLKQWKFNPGDLDDRKLWPRYMAAYETMMARCSTPYAPWRLVPSDKKWRRNAAVARIVRGALEDMHPKPRPPGFDPKRFTID
jgi:PPK2 family polyphosphate:nucleotide phosphotransferase